ncbi:hypothetical protein C8A01DRAFT_15327 [Parachaetomium inaequale]|uniref:Rhodopsin domain-containing protein n=1 Tax=Parachaetomium inaequale TaxID=2588326 RepID=A0AAN6PHB0_9PEZI|nr:hypothetical protein C8A01DRAFT_15327 [Parachaetomium inaequale]
MDGNTASPPALPPGLISNPSESHQVNIVVCVVLTWLIGAVFVALRFYVRGWLLHNAIGVEDWLIVVALVFSGATSAGIIEQTVYGMGRHFLDIDPAAMTPMMRAGWYIVLWYMLSLLATKTAILLLYLRILRFQHARYAVWAALLLVLATNGIWTLYTVLTACTPLRAFWGFTLLLQLEEGGAGAGAVCRPPRDWFVNTALHIGTDTLLYALPLPVVARLRGGGGGARQKMALYGVLALGLFVVAVSAVRLWDLTAQYGRVDYTYDNTSIAYLTVVEINAAIACACCMTLRPLVNRWFPKLWSARGSAEGGQGRDEEMGGAGGSDNTRGPPTIGSRPWRKAGVRRDELDDTTLLDDGDEYTGSGKGEKLIRTDTDVGSFTEAGSGLGSGGMPREPALVHAVERRDAVHVRKCSMFLSLNCN